MNRFYIVSFPKDNLREIEELERKENMMMSEIRRYLNVECYSEEQFKGNFLTNYF